jgi:hypothetical protein
MAAQGEFSLSDTTLDGFETRRVRRQRKSNTTSNVTVAMNRVRLFHITSV